jgi:outer membrane lipoprotein-sorting protein
LAAAPRGEPATPAAEEPTPQPRQQTAAFLPPTDPEPRLPAEAARPLPGDPDAIVAGANEYFNSFNSLSGRFTQISSDGRKQSGQLYLLRPGRMRFDYNAPSALQILADGQHIAIRNTKSGKQEIYPLSQTPVKFLLNRRIRLDKDLRLIRAWAEQDAAMITLEDHSTFGGTVRVTLFFDRAMTRLKSWDVTDTQGKKTTTVLADLSMNPEIAAAEFVIPMAYRN